ncbi:MAG: HAMP domain-containing protein [Deltaproteobacteria bacterium]|nr:HAMP domain-containing protein [Deltaproteobacteria bacterium]
MTFRFSIFSKLLIFILPLVCLPIAILGYFSIEAAEERVNRLVRHEQMIKVEGSADKIKNIFYNCRIDLETINSLPLLEDYHIARTFRLNAETEFNYENIQGLFRDFLLRSPFYYQIRFLDAQGQELISQCASDIIVVKDAREDSGFFEKARLTHPGNICFSDILFSHRRNGYVMHWAIPFYSGWREFSGLIVIDLDYEKIIQLVSGIRMGEKGYAFLVDSQGRNTAHPHYAPYQLNIDSYLEPSLKELVQEMITGASSWKSYVHDNVEKVAAFAPIPAMGWSLAVTIPVDELGKEALAIKLRVIEVAAIIFIFAVVGVSVLSYYLLRPVRELVAATNRMAEGNLNQEIPLRSRDELGDLTRSFNHMVKNIARIQNELVRSEKLISLGRLSAGVAHEIRNPLNAMKGAIVHIQRRRAGDPLIEEYTHLVSEEIDRLSFFVTEFLHFARQPQPKPVPTDLNQLLLSTQNLFAKRADEMGIRMCNHLDPGLPRMSVDPNQMEQVFINVLINAMDALPSGGDITFSTHLHDAMENGGRPDQVRIEIRDNGIGIAEANAQHIFDPFFSTKESGTGLGLPLSLGIVESHQGRMTISSGCENGTMVVIDLPIKTEQLI